MSAAADIRARDVVAWSDGNLLSGDADLLFESVSIDTRSCEPGALFFAIRGPRHDAHRFLLQACERGATGLVVERTRARGQSLPAGVACIEVDDSTRALGAVASGHRARFRGPLLAITGSSGKTTTKEMCASVLAALGPCLATHGNLNNEFGVPLTLLRRQPADRSAVIELGMNHRGEIARLAEIARPQIGLVTNIGTAHIEFLGSRDEIAQEKGDLYAALPSDGIALVNLDDERVAAQARRAACRQLTYARGRAAEVSEQGVRFDAGRFHIRIHAAGQTRDVAVRGLADTTVINALAACAAGLAAGARLEDVCEGLAAYQPIRGRMTPVRGAGAITVVDDTYNANPDSLRAALLAVRELAERDASQGARAIAVLGDMGELGDAADAAHREAGALAAGLGFGALLALGERAALVCEGALAAGMKSDDVHIARSHDDAAERVSGLARSGDWVLVKGSRSMQMERVVDALETQESH